MIFDGVPDRVSSTRWVRIQHPFVGSLPRSGSPQPERMSGLTEIVLTEKGKIPQR